MNKINETKTCLHFFLLFYPICRQNQIVFFWENKYRLKILLFITYPIVTHDTYKIGNEPTHNMIKLNKSLCTYRYIYFY